MPRWSNLPKNMYKSASEYLQPGYSAHNPHLGDISSSLDKKTSQMPRNVGRPSAPAQSAISSALVSKGALERDILFATELCSWRHMLAAHIFEGQHQFGGLLIDECSAPRGPTPSLTSESVRGGMMIKSR